MKRGAAWAAGFFFLALLCAIGYTAWKAWRPSEAQVCQVCVRPIHSHTRTAGMTGTRRESFCCPACALTANGQDGRAVRIIELTDYETNAPLEPSGAYLVRGSDVNMCAQSHGPLDPDKQPTVVHFDRCSPSLLAFAGKEGAVSFARQHGGDVLTFSELAAFYSR